jgi:hypothetical protein
MSEQQWYALTEQQVNTLKNVLEIVERGYDEQKGRYQEEINPLLEDAYRALSASLVADSIQRIPSPGDRWRGLDRKDLEVVTAALSYLEDFVTEHGKGTNPGRDHVTALYRNCADEMTRRYPNWLNEPGLANHG